MNPSKRAEVVRKYNTRVALRKAEQIERDFSEMVETLHRVARDLRKTETMDPLVRREIARTKIAVLDLALTLAEHTAAIRAALSQDPRTHTCNDPMIAATGINPPCEACDQDAPKEGI